MRPRIIDALFFKKKRHLGCLKVAPSRQRMAFVRAGLLSLAMLLVACSDKAEDDRALRQSPETHDSAASLEASTNRPQRQLQPYDDISFLESLGEQLRTARAERATLERRGAQVESVRYRTRHRTDWDQPEFEPNPEQVQ